MACQPGKAGAGTPECPGHRATTGVTARPGRGVQLDAAVHGELLRVAASAAICSWAVGDRRGAGLLDLAAGVALHLLASRSGADAMGTGMAQARRPCKRIAWRGDRQLQEQGLAGALLRHLDLLVEGRSRPLRGMAETRRPG